MFVGWPRYQRALTLNGANVRYWRKADGPGLDPTVTKATIPVMRRFSITTTFLALAALLAPCLAVPPPPPPPDASQTTQTFLRVIRDRDFPTYVQLMADDLVVHQSGNSIALDKEAWLRQIKQQFSNPYFRVQILRVFETSGMDGGDFVTRVLIAEEVDNFGGPIPGDCCALFRTETLTLRGKQVSRIDLSMEYQHQMDAEGRLLH